jgi:hypothetical protein
MAKFVGSDGDITSSEGESIGSALNYISAYKKDKEIINEDRDTSLILPSEYTSENEKSIYFYYFTKFKHTLDKPEIMSKEIAQRMARVYAKKFNSDEVLLKINLYLKDFKEMPKPTIANTSKELVITKKAPILAERSYPFKNNTESLENDKAELCNIINCEFLSFTIKNDSFCVGCGKGEKKCTLEADMTPIDKMMFELFKEQLGDEVKARKLVILSRSIQNMPKKEDSVVIKKFTRKDTPSLSKSRLRGELKYAVTLDDEAYFDKMDLTEEELNYIKLQEDKAEKEKDNFLQKEIDELPLAKLDFQGDLDAGNKENQLNIASSDTPTKKKRSRKKKDTTIL